jgi:GntR family transcriptional regulator
MTEAFQPGQPIYLQLIQRICRSIVRGELNAGDKLPSVREMAVQSGVNPNTMQRVYGELERMGVVETRRGQGTYVTEDQGLLNRLREDLKQEQITTFIQEMLEAGFTDEEIMRGVELALRSAKHD